MAYRILIVDDSPLIRQVVKKSITMSGLDIDEMFEAGNGVEALEMMRNEWIDIVFADLNMPKMNGQEMVDEMSRDNMLVSIPVVIVSSEHNEERINSLKETGIRAYIKKPFRPENFRDVVQDILGAMGE